MYNELFKLNEAPFRLTPDPQFLFASKQHSRAKAYMESTIWLADGFVVITGEIGAGKTTLIESFLADLPDDVVLAHVNQTQLTPVEFLQAVLVEFGFHEFHERKVELLAKLRDYMIEQYSQGKTLLLIVDEAQNLSHKTLEEIRLLSGIEAQKEKPLRIILAGQPELADKLDSLRLEQLRQRVRLRFHLSTLSRRETHEYVQHRLDVAGAHGRKVFDKDALDLIFRYSGGVPRLINVLCDTSMLCGFSEEKDSIDVGLVNEAIKELQWVEYSKRHENRGLYSAAADDGGAARPSRPIEVVDEELPPNVPARFDVLFKDQHITEFHLPLGRAVVGRTADNDLQIRSRFISRHHLQIITDARRSTVEDLNSTNGTYVLSKRVQCHQLCDGDIINLGEHKLVYRDLRTGVNYSPGTQHFDDKASCTDRFADADVPSKGSVSESMPEAVADPAASDQDQAEPTPSSGSSKAKTIVGSDAHDEEPEFEGKVTEVYAETRKS